MYVSSVFLTAVAISMDAFAMAVCRSVDAWRPNMREGLSISVFFALSEMTASFLGWYLGHYSLHYVSSIAPLISGVALCGLGVYALYNAFFSHKSANKTSSLPCCFISLRGLVFGGAITSVDAMTLGVSYAFLDIPITSVALAIGTCSLTLTGVGLCCGSFLGGRIGSFAQYFAALLLIVTGILLII